MKTIFMAAAFGLATTAASASTLDFSDVTYDAANESFFINEITTNVDLIVETINGTSQGSNNVANNQSALSGEGFQINMGVLTPENTADYRFSFVDNNGDAVVLNDASIGIFDLDFSGREVVTLLSPAAYTLTTDTRVSVGTDADGNVEFRGATPDNVPNPGSLTLTADQQNASLLLSYGDVSSFDLRLTIDETNGSGRNFLFGNLTFTEETVTVNPAPVPLPAGGLMLVSAFGLFALRRNKKA